MREHISLSKNGYSKMREDTDIVEKTEILYISGTFKDANCFLTDVADELNDSGILILDFCRQRLILKTEYVRLRCVPMNSCLINGCLARGKYFIRGYGVYEYEFEKRIAFRIRPGTREITKYQELLDLLSGKKI